MNQLKHTHIPEPAPSARTLNGVDLTKSVLPIGACRAIWPVCPSCSETIFPGQVYTLIRLGPGADPTERRRAREGHTYNAVRVPIHWACATGQED